jgi:hypothetical protein
MNQQDDHEQYWEQLRNIGFSEEMIEIYKQKVQESARQTNDWAAQVGLLANNISQYNQLLAGDDADVNDADEEPLTILLHSHTRLSAAQQWAVACGADIAFVNRQYLNDITTGASRQDCRRQLSEWWDIDGPETLQEMIAWLRESGHRIEYDLIWQAINAVSMKESKTFLKEYIVTNELEEAVVMERLRNTRDALELFREKELISHSLQPDMLIWDFARIINLSRVGYDAGYLTYDQALEYMMGCVPAIRRTYTSWKHLSLSYQFARCVWNGVETGNFEALFSNMEYLLSAPESPWKHLAFAESISL